MSKNENNLVELKSCMVEDVIVRITLDGSFQRGRLYKDRVTDGEKRKFRNYLASEMNSTLNRILLANSYDDQAHYKTIEDFASRVSSDCKSVLKDNTLRIGIAQKLLNLYWKSNWLLKPNVKMPIHCPFDSIVIGALNKSVRSMRWTTLNKITDYKALVEAAKETAKNHNSVAEWELFYYQQKINYGRS